MSERKVFKYIVANMGSCMLSVLQGYPRNRDNQVPGSCVGGANATLMQAQFAGLLPGHHCYMQQWNPK